MQTLIIYYSYEGNTRFIAQKMAEAINADLMELKPIKEMKSKGFMKYVWGGKAAVMKSRPKLEDLTHKIEDYDLIIFGTPVWAGTFAPVFNTLFKEHDIKDKKVATFCCHAGGMGKVKLHFKDKLNCNEYLGELDILDPLESGQDHKAKMATSWVKGLVN